MLSTSCISSLVCPLVLRSAFRQPSELRFLLPRSLLGRVVLQYEPPTLPPGPRRVRVPPEGRMRHRGRGRRRHAQAHARRQGESVGDAVRGHKAGCVASMHPTDEPFISRASGTRCLLHLSLRRLICLFPWIPQLPDCTAPRPQAAKAAAANGMPCGHARLPTVKEHRACDELPDGTE